MFRLRILFESVPGALANARISPRMEYKNLPTRVFNRARVDDLGRQTHPSSFDIAPGDNEDEFVAVAVANHRKSMKLLLFCPRVKVEKPVASTPRGRLLLFYPIHSLIASAVLLSLRNTGCYGVQLIV